MDVNQNQHTSGTLEGENAQLRKEVDDLRYKLVVANCTIEACNDRIRYEARRAGGHEKSRNEAEKHCRRISEERDRLRKDLDEATNYCRCAYCFKKVEKDTSKMMEHAETCKKHPLHISVHLEGRLNEALEVLKKCLVPLSALDMSVQWELCDELRGEIKSALDSVEEFFKKHEHENQHDNKKNETGG